MDAAIYALRDLENLSIDADNPIAVSNVTGIMKGKALVMDISTIAAPSNEHTSAISKTRYADIRMRLKAMYKPSNAKGNVTHNR